LLLLAALVVAFDALVAPFASNPLNHGRCQR
jgi:hypothetical protein